MSKFDEFSDIFGNGLKEIAIDILGGFKTEAIKDGKEFFKNSEGDFKRWMLLLEQKKITRDDFEWLVTGRRDVMELLELKQAGLFYVRLDRFRNAVLNLFINTTFKVFL